MISNGQTVCVKHTASSSVNTSVTTTLTINGKATKFTSTTTASLLLPVISAIVSSSAIPTGATVGWTTNEAADSQLEYGLTTAYGSTTTLDTALVTSHSQIAGGLSAATVYHFRVKSRDAAGNLATSGDFTFTTPASGDTTPPTVPAGLILNNIRTARMTLSWRPSTDNVGVAGYRLDMSTDSGFTGFVPSYHDRDLGNVTAFRLSGLLSRTTYYIRVRAYDSAGNISASSVSVSAHTN
jgi:chitinase